MKGHEGPRFAEGVDLPVQHDVGFTTPLPAQRNSKAHKPVTMVVAAEPTDVVPLDFTLAEARLDSPNPVARYVAFAVEREKIRKLKESGAPKPWTANPNLASRRFCNVHREHDAVTKWVAAHVVEANRSDPDLWFRVAVARLINEPKTLVEVLPYLVPFAAAKVRAILEAREARGETIWRGVYRSAMARKGQSRIDRLVEEILAPMWNKREQVRPRFGDTLTACCARLEDCTGMGPFLAAQVIADLKHVLPLNSAPDWWTFAAPGTGSMQGLNRVREREVKAGWNRAEWYRELMILRAETAPLFTAAGIEPLCAQNQQNLCCEFDKLERWTSEAINKPAREPKPKRKTKTSPGVELVEQLPDAPAPTQREAAKFSNDLDSDPTITESAAVTTQTREAETESEQPQAGERPAAAAPKSPIEAGEQERQRGSSSELEPNRDEAARFLALLDPATTHFTFQTFDDNKDRKDSTLAKILHGTLDQHFATLSRLNSAGAGIFVTVNETNLRGRTAKDITRVRCLFVDLDGAPLDPVLVELPQVHVVVESSPGRWQAYWHVADVPLTAFKAQQQALIARFNSDASVHDLPRVMRLPGFGHFKGAPFQTRIVTVNESAPHRGVAFAGGTEAPAAPSVADMIEPGLGIAVEPLPTLAELEAALDVISIPVQGEGEFTQDGAAYAHWIAIGMAIHASTGGSAEGLALFDKWSQKSQHYDAEGLAEKWDTFHPERTGFGKLEKLAFDADPHWRGKLEAAASAAEAPAEPAVVPVDLWAQFEPPALPLELLPKGIADFAGEQGAQIGGDPAGVAMAALTVCAAAISDSIRLKVKRHGGWTESARLWVALVGYASTKKTPLINAATWPLEQTDNMLSRGYANARAAWDALPKQERLPAGRPRQERVCIGDITTEKAGEILADSPNGVLCIRDELSGWFGAMERYARQRGVHSDHAFWLQSYNGARYTVDRISRGSINIEHLGISLLGGIQPETLRQIAAGTADDGLIQRFAPIMLRPSSLDRDEAFPPAAVSYADLIHRLHALRPLAAPLELSSGARTIREHCAACHHDLEQTYETLNKRFATHIGKYNGIFVRLCLTWHCVEAVAQGAPLPAVVAEETAQRVADFMHGFMLPHATAFYTEVFGLADNHDQLTAVAGYILAHKLEVLTNRDIARGSRSMRGLKKFEVEHIYHQLELAGWLDRIPGRYPSSPSRWQVNPEVHKQHAVRAEQERTRRQRERQIIADLIHNQRQQGQPAGDGAATSAQPKGETA